MCSKEAVFFCASGFFTACFIYIYSKRNLKNDEIMTNNQKGNTVADPTHQKEEETELPS